MKSRICLGLLLAPGLLGAVGCRRDRQDQAPALTASASASARVVDRLEPGELGEGKDTAFDLVLPRMMRVRARGPFEVQAEGTVPAERVANYLRKRLQAESVELGAARTVFERARLRQAQSSKVLQVEVISQESRTLLVVKDISLPKIDPSLTPEQRWKQHGFDPQGRLLDPSHLE